MMRVPESEIANRISAFQALLEANGVDAAIIRQNADLYYFTGTVQDAHLIVPVSGRPVFCVRRDVRRAENQSPIRPIVSMKSFSELRSFLAAACGGSSAKRLGMELDVLPANYFLMYKDKVFPNQEIIDVGGLIRQVRMIKSEWEIEMMREAGACSRAIADAVPRILREGISEWELSVELEAVARKSGHLGIYRYRTLNLDMSFGHILSGPEATIPSYFDSVTGGEGISPAFGQGASNRKIGRGEVVSVDTMVCRHGYFNDQTRNYSIGPPHESLQDAYGLSMMVHSRFKSEARPGVEAGELYRMVGRWVEAAGWTKWFMGWGETRASFVGHGIGVEVDEYPFIADGQNMLLRQGMTFAFEPKFVIPGTGIAGLENTYVVTPNGLESLNTAPEELIVV